MSRPPLPPFNEQTAIEKVRLAEDGWNSRDPAKVTLAYTVDTRWRNRVEFANGRDEVQARDDGDGGADPLQDDANREADRTSHGRHRTPTRRATWGACGRRPWAWTSGRP